MPITRSEYATNKAKYEAGRMPKEAWDAFRNQALAEASALKAKASSAPPAKNDTVHTAIGIAKALVPPGVEFFVKMGDPDPNVQEKGWEMARSFGRGLLSGATRALAPGVGKYGPTPPVSTPWGVAKPEDEMLAGTSMLAGAGTIKGALSAAEKVAAIGSKTVTMPVKKAVPFYAKVLSRPPVLLERFPAGRAFNRLANRAEDIVRQVESEGLVQMEDVIASLSHSERKWARANFRTAFRAGTPMPSEGLQKLADTWDGVAKGLAFQAKEAGLDFGEQARYLPDYWTDDATLAFEARKGAVWEAIVDWARETKGIDEEDLKGIVERIAPREGITQVRKSSSLEFRKVLGLPDEVMVDGKPVKLVDDDALSNMGKYIKDSSRRIGIVKSFGKDDSVIRGILNSAGADPSARKLIKDQWKVLQGISDSPGFYQSAIGRSILGMESASRAIQLSGSVVANTTGWMQAAQKYGLFNTLRAQADVVAAWGADKFKPSWFRDSRLRVDMARLEGGWARHTLDRLAQTEGFGAPIGVSQKIGLASKAALKATGLELVERNTNKLSALAAQQYVADIFNRLRKGGKGGLGRLIGADEGSLRNALKRDFQWDDADIDRIINGGMSNLDRVRVSRIAPALTNAFAESQRIRPVWMRHPLAQRALAYTSFVRIRGNMASDAIQEAFGRGNVKPLAKLLGYGVLAGEAESALKGYLKNRERQDKNFAHRLFNDLMASATFGYLGPVYEDAKYAATSRGTVPEKVGEFVDDTVVPPFVSTIKDIGDFIFTDQTAEQTARKVSPAADILIAQARKYMTPAKAARQKAEQARRAKRRMKATPLP